MRTHRIVLTGALTLAASGLTVAEAAPPKRPAPACLQVTDPSGDAKVLSAVESNSLDIVSADIATGPRALVAAVRTHGGDEAEPVLVGGRTFLFEWTVGGVPQRLTLLEYDTNERVGRFDPNTGDTDSSDVISVPVAYDGTAKTVTWTVPRKSVPALQKRGAKFTGLTARSGDGRNIRTTGTSGHGGADVATSGKTYTDYMPTCLKGT